jgi:outer membrane assembly lipoprotein YfiO
MSNDPEQALARAGGVMTHAGQQARATSATIWLLTLVACLLASLSSGCGASNPHPAGTFERGQYWLERGRYQDAADAFGVFVRQNPTDSLAAQAQFEKARAYQRNREYPLAAVEFEILVKDFPISPLVEDALFHQGECYYFQIGRIERDVTPAHEARLHWLDFARRYPNSRFMPQVRQYMQEIADLMIRKRLQRIDVYRQLRRWDAVALSLDRALQEEPSSRLLDEVLWRRGQVAERQGDSAVAIAMYQRLLHEFPASVHHGRAQSALRRLQTHDGAAP